MSDQRCAFGGRGLMAATVATVAYLGLEARAVEVQVQLTSGVPKFTIVGLARQGRRRKPRAGPRRARRDRPRASAQGHHRQPLAGRPAQGRLALRPADRARACSRRSARPTPRRCRIMSRSASCASTGGSPPRRACCSPRSTPRRSDKGLICPAAQGSEASWAGELDVIAAPDLLALLAHLKGTSAGRRAAAGRGRAARRRPRPRPGQGPGGRQARARDRRGRRPQSADERPARRGQVAARRLPSGHPAAASAERGARSLDGRVGRGRARRRQDPAPAAVPRAAPQRVDAGAGRRRPAGPAGRDQPRAPRRAVPRRAARVPARRCSIRCASRSRPAASASPAPTPTSPSRRGCSWSRR